LKKIAVISDCTYRSSTPDYINNLSFYGSEPYHAVIAKGLAQKGYDVHWFAPSGSEPIGTFHPLVCLNGDWTDKETLDETSLEHLKIEYLQDFDFVLDFSANAQNVEQLAFFYGYRNYGTFRNGYVAFDVPRVKLAFRNYIVPSHQNKRIFEQHGFTNDTVSVIYYGIPEFYCPTPNYVSEEEEEYYSILGMNLLFEKYFLYPHRPTPEKGSLHILQLAKMFPEETFVFMVSNNPLIEHQTALLDLKNKAGDSKNIRFVELPLTNKHHYYKRELMRHAKAILSPFNPHIYKEGFGLANAEAVACGTPILITDSESSRELWIDEKDGLILPYDDRMAAFRMAIKHFGSYDFHPENKFTVDDCISNYEKYMNKIIEKNTSSIVVR
jgi:glycosyltransferase involved in cell wall biosynthesis